MDAGQRCRESRGKRAKERRAECSIPARWRRRGEADWALSPLFAHHKTGRRRSLIPALRQQAVDSDLAAALKQRSAGENTIVQRGAGYCIWKESPLDHRWWWRKWFLRTVKFDRFLDYAGYRFSATMRI
ncbi:hypothetical protein KCP78_02975 [Salmonella enterica subsp. enterica]|nr:hypothetical protein KCP78_02975 [Salmonella enterica subsp. enterica]